MNAEHKANSLMTLILCATLIAVVGIMAQCSVKVEALDSRISECAKNGGHWKSNGGDGFCEERAK